MNVVEIIPDTIQGEGQFSGRACNFIRLAGCGAHCQFCDTKESWNLQSGKEMEVQEIMKLLPVYPDLTVITGGDPLLQDCDQLISCLENSGHEVHLECHSLGMEIHQSWIKRIDEITFSPKYHLEYKFLWEIPYRSSMKLLLSPDPKMISGVKFWLDKAGVGVVGGDIYIQLLTDESQDIDRSVEIFKSLSKEYSGLNLRLSSQMHKVWGVK